MGTVTAMDAGKPSALTREMRPTLDGLMPTAFGREGRLVAQQAIDARLDVALLPPPDARLRLAGAPHDLLVPWPSAVASTISARQTLLRELLRST